MPSDSHSAGDPEDIRAYWTDERRKAAVPVQPPSQTLAEDPTHLGEERPGGPPASTDTSEGPSAEDDPPAPTAEKVLAFVTGLQPNPSDYPQRTVGKLFYRSGGQDCAASAAVVNRAGILTAAHCTRSPQSGEWSTHMAFAPAYDDGLSGYGLWPVGEMFVSNAWLGPPLDVSYDFSFCRVPPTHDGHLIGDVVGFLGIIINQPDGLTWRDLGYPAEAIPGYPFDGKRMWNCTGDFRSRAGGTLRKDGNLTPGASGGPWIIESEGKFYANGDYSMWFNTPPTLNSTPYFRDAVLQLFHDAFG